MGRSNARGVLLGSTALIAVLAAGTAGAVTYNVPAATTQTDASNITPTSPPPPLNQVIKNGAGTEILSGNNSYTGPTTVNAGTLQAGSTTAFGSNSATSVATSATLDLGGFSVSIGSLAGSGAVTSSGAPAVLTVGGDNTSTSFSGTILNGPPNPGQAIGLTKVGTGTLTLSNTTDGAGAYNYTGATTIVAGTLAIASPAILDQSDVSVAAGAEFDISGFSDPNTAFTVNSLSGAGTVQLGTIGLDIRNSSSFAGTIVDAPKPDAGGGGVAIDAGTLTLSAASTYHGNTTVGIGATLVLEGSASLANSTMNMQTGSVLDISQTTAGTTIGGLEGGGGTVALGSKTLTVSATNTFGVFDSVIEDGGIAGGTGGGLTLTGGTVSISGAGLALTRVNTYTGRTTIGVHSYLDLQGAGSIAASSGVVNNGFFSIFGLTNGGTSIKSLTGGGPDSAVALGANTLTVTAATGTYTGTLGNFGETGGFTVAGGTQTLADVESFYSGATTIGAGAGLILTGTTGLSNSSGIVANGTFDISGEANGGTSIQSLSGGAAGVVLLGANTLTLTAAAGTFSGAIRGSGGLTLVGPADGFPGGTEVLAGNSTYTGPTHVKAGTLAAGSTTGFAAASAFTVDAGAVLDLRGFDETIGSLAGGGKVSNTGAGAAVLTTGGDNGSTVFSGVVQDDGPTGLTKTGSGTFILSGDNTYTGPTTVAGGTLIVTRSIAGSAVTVDSGTTFGGGATVGALSVAAGATVAPGILTPGSTLTVVGDVGLAGTTYRVAVDAAGQTDRIAAGGTATIGGGTVQVLGAPTVGLFPIVAASALTGRFDTLDAPVTFFGASHLVYTATSVLLSEDQTRSFVSVAATPNQAGAATGLAGVPPSSPVFVAAFRLPGAASAQQAFDALSGEAHASAVSGAFEDARLTREAILDRLDGPYGSLPPQGLAAYSAADVPASVKPYVRPSPWAFWGQSFGASGRIGGDGNAATLNRDLAGFILGGDFSPDPRYRVGVAAGYTNSWIKVDPRASSGTIESVFAGLYGGAALGPWRLRGGALYAFDQFHLDRTVAFPGFFEAEKSRYGGGTGQVFGEAGYHVDFGRYAVEPFVGAMAMAIHTDGFTETGGAAALVGASRSYGFEATTLGVKGEMPLFASLPLVLKGTLGWRHVFGDVTPDARLAFASSAGVPFTVAGAPIAHDALVTEAGIDWKVTANATAGLYYSGQIASRTYDNAVRGKLEVSF